LETLGPGLKSVGSRNLKFGVGPKILGPEWTGTCHKIYFFGEFGKFTKRPPYNQILRTFFGIIFFDLRPHQIWGSMENLDFGVLA
jgi:hypothetical protein